VPRVSISLVIGVFARSQPSLSAGALQTFTDFDLDIGTIIICVKHWLVLHLEGVIQVPGHMFRPTLHESLLKRGPFIARQLLRQRAIQSPRCLHRSPNNSPGRKTCFMCEAMACAWWMRRALDQLDLACRSSRFRREASSSSTGATIGCITIYQVRESLP
jgi:hypothetical protein